MAPAAVPTAVPTGPRKPPRNAPAACRMMVAMRAASIVRGGEAKDRRNPPPPLRHQRRDGHTVPLIGMDEAAVLDEDTGVLGGQMRTPPEQQQVAGYPLADRLLVAMAPCGSEEQVFAAGFRPVRRVGRRPFRLAAIDRPPDPPHQA